MEMIAHMQGGEHRGQLTQEVSMGEWPTHKRRTQGWPTHRGWLTHREVSMGDSSHRRQAQGMAHTQGGEHGEWPTGREVSTGEGIAVTL